MCGRFTLVKTEEEIEERFEAKFNQKSYAKNYNAAPSNLLPVITGEAPDQIQFFQWGLVPTWSKSTQIAYKTINARKETITEKPAFKNAFASKHCLVLADSYYEWKTEGKDKIPYRITVNNGDTFAFAGIWEVWESVSTKIPLYSFSIITIPALPEISHLHERMPVILSAKSEKAWLNSNKNEKNSMELLKAPELTLHYYSVSKKVNKVFNNSPELIEPYNYPIQGSLF